MDNSDSEIFKTCSTCGKVWTTRLVFLSDPDIKMAGYMVNFKALRLGLFLFNHDRKDCRTTLAFKAEDFMDLYNGPVFEQRMTGTDSCPGYCMHQGALEVCKAQCECAFVREVLQVVKNHPKTGVGQERLAIRPY